MQKLFNPSSELPTKSTSRLVNWLVLVCILFLIGICVIISKIGLSQWYLILIVSILIGLLFFFSLIIWRQPEVSSIKTFKVKFKTFCKHKCWIFNYFFFFKIPFVPFIPFLSVFFNVYMMTTLGGATWIRFIVWFAIGNTFSLY